MLAGSAEAGISSVAPQSARRGLYMDLIKGPNLATSSSMRPDETLWTSTPRRYSLHEQGIDREKETSRAHKLRTSAMDLDEAGVGGGGSSVGYERPKLAIKGVRAVNIMETLSQLAGSEALSPRRLLKSTLPATPVSAASPSRSKTRGRTPDWIKKIFDQAKRGQLEQLRVSLRDMEATLVRNLSDHHGNNLLHVVACQGHEGALAWLCSFLQAAHLQLEGALADENRSGLTPAACAVKYGHSNCVEWLVTNTRLREKLSAKDGERCLLHVAAKYNQDSVLQWLVNAMKARQIGLDQRDHCGDTPLHLAARTGQLDTCRILLSNGSNVSAKNDLGLKASDMALAAGHPAVQHYLNLFESSLCVAGELSLVQKNFEALRSENSELKGYFRDVLGIGKRLAKERDEMCRDAVSRASKGCTAHEKAVAAISLLEEENRALRERLGLEEEEDSVTTEAAASAVQALLQPSDLLGAHWKGLVVSGLADMEHRLLMAEEAWRKLSFHSNSDRIPFSFDKVPLDLIRHQLEQIEEQQKSVAASARVGMRSSSRSLSSSESSLDTLLSLQTGGTGDNIYSQLIEPVASPSSVPPPVVAPPSKKELRRRLQDMALTSESGNASVLEVIEPTTSESEAEEAATTFGQPFRAASNSSPRLKAFSLSLEDELEKCVRDCPDSVRKCASVQDLLDAEVRPPDNQPDLLIGTVSSEDTPDAVPAIKKRTFLQKIGFKRKTGRGLVHKMTPDDFKETYMPRESPAASSIEAEELPCPSPEESKEPESAEKVSGSVQEEPPPPVPPAPSSRLVTDIKTGHLQHLEAMSVTTSEDSGIVARPSSSASKSDSLLSSRPDSSSSSFFKGFSLRLSLAADGRVSPAPSDLSTARLLTKIEEMRLCEDEPDTKMATRIKLPDKKRDVPRSSMEKDKILPKEAKSVEKASIKSLAAPAGAGAAVGRKSSERAWYDLSDEEPDLLSSATRLSAAIRSSSDEEVNCA